MQSANGNILLNDNSLEYFSYVRKDIQSIVPDQLDSVLEIGCATGATMAWLRTIRAISYASGVEIVPEAAELARSVFDEVRVGSVEPFPSSPDRLFDAVIALDVLEHLVDPWSVVRVLAGHLKSNGVFLASIPNIAYGATSAALFLRGEWDYQNDGILDKTHLRFFTEKAACSLFTDNGYVIEKLDYITRFPNILSFMGNAPRWRWYSQKFLRNILPARFFNYQFLIRARKIS